MLPSDLKNLLIEMTSQQYSYCVMYKGQSMGKWPNMRKVGIGMTNLKLISIWLAN